ncbi:MAG: citrate/2-methylcitrate synthase [Planctomycetota bacterium]|jgi:hypothetical protein
MAEPAPDFYLGTSIDGVHINAEQLNVRSRDLNELIGTVTYTEALFHILLGRMPNELERKLFDLVLVSFHGGFGLLPPTTLIPRLVAGTGVGTAQAMAAGFLASGPYHVGAAELAMKMYREIADEFFESHDAETAATAGELEQFAYEAAKVRLERGETLGGFGHPLLRKDPRPIHTRRVIAELGANGPFFDVYDGVARLLQEAKGIPPNVDGITGAIMLHLGFQPQHGTGLFLLSRSAGMLAHIVEEQTEMPYQTMKRFMFMPVAMPKLFNADFKKINKWFNGLRDSKTFNRIRNAMPSAARKARSEAAEKEQIDQVALAEFRSARNTESVQKPAATAGNSDRFVSQQHAEAVDAQAEEAASQLLAESSSPELLAGAAFFLSGCLQSLASEGGENSEKMESLVSSALSLIEEAGSTADK